MGRMNGRQHRDNEPEDVSVGLEVCGSSDARHYGGTGVVEFEDSAARYNTYIHVTQMWLQVKLLLCSVRLVGMLRS